MCGDDSDPVMGFQSQKLEAKRRATVALRPPLGAWLRSLLGISAKSGECHCCLRRPLAPPALRQPDFISYESMPRSDIDLQRAARRSFSLDDVGWRFACVPTNDT
jgi:hypothetical protein